MIHMAAGDSGEFIVRFRRDGYWELSTPGDCAPTDTPMLRAVTAAIESSAAGAQQIA